MAVYEVQYKYPGSYWMVSGEVEASSKAAALRKAKRGLSKDEIKRTRWKAVAVKSNLPKLRPGVWIKADKVRVVQRNGRKVVEIKRFVKAPKRKAARRRRRK